KTSMTTEDYLQDRLDQQVAWYERKSKINKTRYRSLKLLVICFSVTIPFLTGLINDSTQWLKIAVGIGGVMIAFCEGMISLFKYQENWLQYRNTAELLRREKILFLTQSGPYETNTSLNYLVERAESIMSKENQSWIKVQKSNESTKKK
ncbi:MAG: DUF4231 domain-containing protein, partial [Bacteroidota bacterium]